MPKTAPNTFSPLFALAARFRHAKGSCEYEIGACGEIFTLVTGGPTSKAKNYAILEVLAPLIAEGLVKTRTRTFAPKGCPGGRPRPALIDQNLLVLTPAGLEAIRPLFGDVDAYRAEQAAGFRVSTLAEIAKLRRKLSADDVDGAARTAGLSAWGEPFVESSMDSASYDNLCRFRHALLCRLPSKSPVY